MLRLKVDDSQSTLVSIGKEVTALFGTSFEFHNPITNTMARVSCRRDAVTGEIRAHGAAV